MKYINKKSHLQKVDIDRFQPSPHINPGQVELLHKQLVSLRLEEVLSAPLVHSLADPQVEPL